MGQRLASGKRPQAKFKILAKLGENLFRTTRVYRFLAKRPKPKWGSFLKQNAEEQSAWQEWWNSPQSARWKNWEALPKKPDAEGGAQ